MAAAPVIGGSGAGLSLAWELPLRGGGVGSSQLRSPRGREFRLIVVPSGPLMGAGTRKCMMSEVSGVVSSIPAQAQVGSTSYYANVPGTDHLVDQEELIHVATSRR